MDRLKRQMAAKQFEEARETLHSLPAKLRRSKHFMLQEVMIVSDLGDNEEYLRVLTEFEKTFPNDASLDLVRIDGLFLRKDYDQLLVVIDRLDKRIGGDPYLDVLRSGIYRLLDKPTEALAAAKRATVAEPTLEDGWWQLFTEQCAAQQFADALPTLETLRDKFGSPTDAESLAADPRFTAFAASPEYAAWIEKAPR